MHSEHNGPDHVRRSTAGKAEFLHGNGIGILVSITKLKETVRYQQERREYASVRRPHSSRLT